MILTEETLYRQSWYPFLKIKLFSAQGNIVKKSSILLLILMFTFFSFVAFPEMTGLKIATDMKIANEGFIGEEATMKMILIDSHGTQIERILTGKVKEVLKDGTKSLSTFLNPMDVNGTKMLTWSHKKEDDDQWLYLPSLRRVKRINSSNKSASFMGSEFSYEDLGSQEVEKYTYKFIQEEKEQWVIERYPLKESGYKKQNVIISKKYMNPLQIDYFDRRGELLKQAFFSNYQQYTVNNKKLWRSNKIQMKNVQTHKESIFSWDERKLGIKFSDSVFNQNSLK
jgi:outer membrane lipoprotein-sorting protein